MSGTNPTSAPAWATATFARSARRRLRRSQACGRRAARGARATAASAGARGDWLQSADAAVPKLLIGAWVLVYAGDADYIGNWIGVAPSLPWSGRAAFGNATDVAWLGDTEQQLARWRRGRAARGVRGHRVASDQPAVVRCASG